MDESKPAVAASINADARSVTIVIEPEQQTQQRVSNRRLMKKASSRKLLGKVDENGDSEEPALEPTFVDVMESLVFDTSSTDSLASRRARKTYSMGRRDFETVKLHSQPWRARWSAEHLEGNEIALLASSGQDPTGEGSPPSVPPSPGAPGSPGAASLGIPNAAAPPPPQQHRSLCRLPVVRPDSRQAMVWGLVTLVVDLTYSAFLVPLGIAFVTNTSTLTWFTVLDLLAGIVYVLDIVANFHTGFVATFEMERRLVMDSRLVAAVYLRRGTFYVDLLAALPILNFSLVFAASSGKAASATLVRALTTLRMLRLFRVVAIIQRLFLSAVSGGPSELGGGRASRLINPTTLYFCNMAYIAAALINFLSCLWYGVARLEGRDVSWLAAKGLEDASNARCYLASVYFAMTTVFTVGYGDITPTTGIEQGVAMVIMSLGVVFFGFLISSLGQFIINSSKQARRAQRVNAKLDDVRAWVSQNNVPYNIRRGIETYYTEVWVRHQEQEKFMELFTELPVELRCRIAEQVMQEGGFLPTLDANERKAVAALVSPLGLAVGHNLCQEGDPADCIWLLQQGELLALQNGKPLGRVPAGMVIGATAIFADKIPYCATQHYTFRATKYCKLWMLQMRHLQLLIQNIPHLLESLKEGIRQRVPKRGQAATRSWLMYDELFSMLDNTQQAEQLARELGISGRDFRSAAETVRRAATVRRSSV